MNKNKTQTSRPSYEIDLGEKIITFDSSLHNEGILVLAFRRKLLVLGLEYPTEETFTFDYRKINQIPEAEVRIIKLCSRLIVRDILMAVCSSYEIKIYSANEAEINCVQRIPAHDNYINSIDFSDEYLASGSDDHTCKIFSVKDNFEEHTVLNFSASVMGVKFNSEEEPSKLLIAVKNGNLFIYCLKLRQSLYSFQVQSPLMSFDWSTKNPCIVAAIAGDQVFYLDISKPEAPVYSKRLSDVGKIVKIHPQNPLVSSIIMSRSGTDMKVMHQKSTIPIFSTKLIAYAGNVCWNGSYLIAGSDHKICFFKISAT